MLKKDILCRAALYPKFVTPDGVFDPEKLLSLHPENDQKYSMSVASKFMCRNDAGVHGYGCRAADLANERFVRDNGRDPEPFNEQIHYLGYYEFYFADIELLPLEYYNAYCHWKPENGLEMHFQIDLEQNAKQSSKKQRRDDRRAAIGILFDCVSGPRRHIRESDEPHRDLLELVDLPDRIRKAAAPA